MWDHSASLLSLLSPSPQTFLKASTPLQNCIQQANTSQTKVDFQSPLLIHNQTKTHSERYHKNNAPRSIAINNAPNHFGQMTMISLHVEPTLA